MLYTVLMWVYGVTSVIVIGLIAYGLWWGHQQAKERSARLMRRSKIDEVWTERKR